VIIVRTPFRISFFGGGSDLKEFYEESPGCVVSTSINKYMYLAIHPFFHQDKIHLKYSRTETVDSIAAIQHPIIRTALKNLSYGTGWEISSNADIPSGTGLGSSSSFTVGLLHTLYAQQGRFVSQEQLAREACDLEIIDLGEPIGKQDQYAAAYGGLNEITFNSDGSVVVGPIILDKATRAELEGCLAAFYTGDVRATGSILAEQKRNTRDNSDKFRSLGQMADMAREARQLLAGKRFDDFGRLLHESWRLKQCLATGISTPKISEIYESGLRAGALGGKLLGAGGGGFVLFYCPRDRMPALRSALQGLRELQFRMDTSGTRVVYASDLD
jgi:D-glycero-alpha-D-manno-heptose-7-phosphate kinase